MATTVTMPVLIAVLATVAGILIVGVGGGLIKPMQARWDGWLASAEQETGRIKEQVQSSSGDTDEGSRSGQELSSNGTSVSSAGATATKPALHTSSN